MSELVLVTSMVRNSSFLNLLSEVRIFCREIPNPHLFSIDRDDVTNCPALQAKGLPCHSQLFSEWLAIINRVTKITFCSGVDFNQIALSISFLCNFIHPCDIVTSKRPANSLLKHYPDGECTVGQS